jgi:RNA recognition motif-containing protein
MKIYVGGLVDAVTSEQLRGAFEAFGKVASAQVVKAHKSDIPRGFGFVEMPIEHEGTAAISALNGRTRMGSSLEVNEIHHPGPRTSHYRRTGRTLTGRNRSKPAVAAPAAAATPAKKA